MGNSLILGLKVDVVFINGELFMDQHVVISSLLDIDLYRIQGGRRQWDGLWSGLLAAHWLPCWSLRRRRGRCGASFSLLAAW